MKLFPNMFVGAVALAMVSIATSAGAASITTQQEALDAPYAAFGFTALGTGFSGNYGARFTGVNGVDYVNFTTPLPGQAAAFFDNRPAFSVLRGGSVTIPVMRTIESFAILFNSPDTYNNIRVNFAGGTFSELPGSAVFSPFNGQAVERSILVSFFPFTWVDSLTLTSTDFSFEVSGIYVKSVPSVGGVPEPSSWAMMLAGFGLVGFTLRRRAANDNGMQLAAA